jgi:RNase P protein component
MLPSSERLTRTQFPSNASHPPFQVVYNPLGTLKYLPFEGIKVAVVTSSKHEKRAVVRNKIRRRLYTLMRGLSGIYILYVSKSSYTMEYKDIQRLWYELLAKHTKTTK